MKRTRVGRTVTVSVLLRTQPCWRQTHKKCCSCRASRLLWVLLLSLDRAIPQRQWQGLAVGGWNTLRFWTVENYNRYHPRKRQGLCDHPQWKGFSKNCWELRWCARGKIVATVKPERPLSFSEPLRGGDWLASCNHSFAFPSGKLKIKTEVSLLRALGVKLFSFIWSMFIQQLNKSLSQTRSTQRIFKT